MVRVSPRAGMALLAILGLWLAAFGTRAMAAGAAQPVKLVDWPTKDTAERRAANTAITALQAHLTGAGLASRRVAMSALSQESTASPVLIAWSSDDPAACGTLQRFLAAGGRVVLFSPSEGVLKAVGTRAADGALPASDTPRRVQMEKAGRKLLPHAPATIEGLSPAGVTVVSSANVLARWDGGTAAIAQSGRALVALSRLPATPTPTSTRLVLALVGNHHPSYWVEAYETLRGRVEGRMKQARARAEALGRREKPVALSAQDRNALNRYGRHLDAAQWVKTAERASAGYAALQQLETDVRALSVRLLPSEPGEVRGVWIHTYRPTDWDRVMKRVRDAGFNSIFVRVGRGGNVIYPSELLPQDAWAAQAPGDELQRAIDAARRHGLDFHAWRVCFHTGSAPKEYHDRLAAEDRLARDPSGKQNPKWANPGDPRNQELELQSILELTRKYDFDGLHLDYIRYPEDPHYDFDYGQVSHVEFEKVLGRRVEQWPQDVISGPLQRAYEDWERENINRLVRHVYTGVKALKPSVQVSAAVWRNHHRYRAAIKQDWPLWVERGWLDFVVPMNYTTDDDVLYDTVKAQVALTEGRMPMVSGVGTWLQSAPDRIADQVEVSRRAGASGYVLFAYNDERILEILDVLAAGAQRQPTTAAYHAPRLNFRLERAIARKDMPHAVVVGEPFHLQVDAPETQPLPAGTGALQVRLEDEQGRSLAVAGTLSSTARSLSAEVTAPRGGFQVVARGQHNGNAVVVRGPLMEGVSAEEMAALRAREVPPRVEGSNLRVGIYAGGMGAEKIAAHLRKQAGLEVFLVHRLHPDHLAPAQAFILPQVNDVADLDAGAEDALRRWVASGGRLLLTHDAVGYRWHPVLFPEVGQGVGLSSRQALRATSAGQSEWSLEYAFRDHIRLKAAPGTQVLAVESSGKNAPVVVGGKVGEGQVFLLGILPGVQGEGELTPSEDRLVRELLGR